MKLKNSYVLLIVMSIFLLISIGSVCASDDASNADIIANESDINVTPIETSVESQDVIVSEKDPKEIPVTVKDNESQAIAIQKGDLNVTENNKTIKFDYNNSIIKITDNLNVGNHSLIISYLGNSNYTKSSTNIILSIFGNYTIQSPDSVNVNSTQIIDLPLNITNGVNIKTVAPEDFEATLSYKDGNNTTTVNINVLDYKNGILSLTYPLADNITSSTIALVYNGEEKLSKNITANRIFNVKVEVINNVAEYKSGNFTYKLTDMDGGNISNKTINLAYSITTGTITFQQTVTAKTDNDGIVTFKNNNMIIPPINIGSSSDTKTALEVGNHTVTLSSTGMKLTNASQKVSIVKATINIKIDDFKEEYGTNKNVTITLTNAKTGDPVKYEYIHLSMPQTTGKDYYFMTSVEGQNKIQVSQLISGTYNLTVTNNDTKNINDIEVKGNITITAKPVKLSVTVPSTYYYNSGNIATVKVTDKATGKAVANAIIFVQVYTGKTSTGIIYQTDAKGVANINYAPAAVGSHKLVISTGDSRYSGSSVTKTVKVKKASAKLTATKPTAYYKSGKYLIIKLTNTKNKKVIYAAKINIKIFISKYRYYNYNGQTGLDGKIRISLDNFKPGTYKVVVSKGESKNFTAKQITTKFVIKKTSAKITPTKLTAKKGANKCFKVTVKNTKTKKAVIGAKVKVQVYTGKKYKTYTVKTNSKGIAQVNVKKLTVGTHAVKIASGDKYVVAKSTKSSIKITK